MSYVWRRGGAIVGSGTSPTLAIPSFSFADEGNYTVTVANGCGTTTSAPFALTVRRPALWFERPSGGSVIVLRNVGGAAGEAYFTAISLDPANSGPAASTNAFWLGLHVTYTELLSQFASQAPPFVGSLDGGGASQFTFPAGAIPPALIGQGVFGVTAFYDPATLQVLASTNLESLTL